MAVDANTGLETQEEKKVTFTDEQQALVNKLIQQKQGEAAREVRTELANTKAQLDTLATELAEAKAKVAAAGTKSGKKEAQEDVEAIKAQMEEIRTSHKALQTELERASEQIKARDKLVLDAKNETVNVRKQVAIQAAASKQAFFDVNDVLTQTQNSIKWDDAKGRFVVLGENGAARTNASLEDMTLDEFYAEYASKKPYMVRGDVKSGTGSTEASRSGLTANGKYEVTQIFGKGSDAALANRLAKENINEYHRLKSVAKSMGIIT